MARIRTIRPEIWESEKVGGMSVLARLTFIGLISLADDEGRGRGDVRFLLARLHAYSRSVDCRLLEHALQEVQSNRLASFYKVDGSSYYNLPGWHDHQKIEKPNKSLIPANPNQSETTPQPLPNHSPTIPQRLGMGMEGNGMEGRTTANEAPSAVDFSRVRIPFGKRKGVHVVNIPADECMIYLRSRGLSAKVKAALQWRINQTQEERNDKRSTGVMTREEILMNQ